MPTVESVKRDIEALGIAGKEEILQYLEEVFVLGSFATEVTTEKETIKNKNFLVQSHTSHIDTKLKDFGLEKQSMFKLCKYLQFCTYTIYT